MGKPRRYTFLGKLFTFIYHLIFIQPFYTITSSTHVNLPNIKPTYPKPNTTAMDLVVDQRTILDEHIPVVKMKETMIYTRENNDD